jgi:hypothetical protein
VLAVAHNQSVLERLEAHDDGVRVFIQQVGTLQVEHHLTDLVGDLRAVAQKLFVALLLPQVLNVLDAAWIVGFWVLHHMKGQDKTIPASEAQQSR